MSLNAEVLDALFDIAVADASLSHPAILVPLGTQPAGWDSGHEAKLVLPSQGPFTWQDAVEPESRDRANADEDVHRVVVLCGDGMTEPTALALMRWCLEVARQWERHSPLHEFGLFLAHSIERTYVGTGLGSASVYNRIPTIRDANAAAAELVNSRFEPIAAASYFSNHGNLRRPIGPPDLDTLGARLVVFAFQHRADVVAQAAEEGVSLDRRLAELDTRAPLWWNQLMQDRALARSCERARALIPDRLAIETSDVPIKAWWDLLARLDHDHDHGLAVLERLL